MRCTIGASGPIIPRTTPGMAQATNPRLRICVSAKSNRNPPIPDSCAEIIRNL
jgi:hypothetical protein